MALVAIAEVEVAAAAAAALAADAGTPRSPREHPTTAFASFAMQFGAHQSSYSL